jgi:hypothetical protein
MIRNRWRFSKSTIAVGVFGLAVGLLAGLTVFTFGQQRPEGARLADPRDSLHVPILTFGPQGPAGLVGAPDDWTHHHLVFSNPGTEEQALANGTHDRWLEIANDPRFILQGLKRNAAARGFGEESTGGAEAREAAKAGHLPLFPIRMPPRPPKGKIKKDWSEGLNAGTINPNTFPAKWSFSTSSASCANDFVIYPTGSAGSTSQASIIAYYNLYSGCTGAGTVPKVDWAYNTGGTVSLSPVFSLDGSQVAFVQTSSSVASLVLLRFPLTPPGTGTLGGPIAPTSASSASAYYNSGAGCTAPCMYTITLSGTNDTWSSPYYDSSTDSLYVGDAAGKLHKFNPVFNGIPAEVTSSWPVQLVHSSTNDTTQTASPVYDPSSGKVFVGTFGGYLYSVGSGNQSTTSGTIYGASSRLDTAYGIRDAVLVDPNAQTVYAFVGYDSSSYSGVYQFSTGFTSGYTPKEVQLIASASGKTTLYQMSGAFDNEYYTASDPSSPSGYLYVCTTSGPAQLYQIAISGNAMGTATSEATITGSQSGSPVFGRCSPITEFLDSSATTTDSTALNNTDSSDTITVASGTGFSNNDYIQIDSEIMKISSGGNTNALTVARAQLGTTEATHSSGATVNDIHDYIFLSVFGGVESGCTNASTDGCIMSFSVTNPSAVALSGTSLNVAATQYLAPTGGLIIDNSVVSGILAGTSQIYFLTTDSSASSCTTAGSGVCAVQASQASP